MKSILCQIGWHQPATKTEWVPSIFAKVVTEAIHTGYCRRCGEVLEVIKFTLDKESPGGYLQQVIKPPTTPK